MKDESVCVCVCVNNEIYFFSILLLIIIFPVTKEKNYHSSGIMAISNPAAVELPNENFLCYYLTQAASQSKDQPRQNNFCILDEPEPWK